MKPTLTLLLLLLCRILPAQTTIPAGAQVSGTWTKAASPYYIKGNIAVPRDSTLVLEPGVQLRFDGMFQMAVYGNIKALGKAGDTIRFYPQDTLNRWRGIRYFGRNRQADSALFAYCRFEYAGPKQSLFESALTLKRGNFYVNHCWFSNNTSVIGSNSLLADSIVSLQIEHCTFINNKNINTNPAITQQVFGAVGITGGSVTDCVFEGNVSRNPYNTNDDFAINGSGSGGILDVNDYASDNTNIIIKRCRFYRNQCALKGSGVVINFRKNGRLLIKDCEFAENTSGRYGCITYVNSNTSAKGSMRVVVENCNFKSNLAANSTTGADAAAITIINYNSYDSMVIRNNVFEKNIAVNSIYVNGMPGDKSIYIIGNTFKNNFSGCMSSISKSQITSIGNLYYNNLYAHYISNKSIDNQFFSINDLYVYNGYNVDTLWLDKQLKQTFSGHYYKFAGGVDISRTTGGVFRNCIFWGNSMVNGKIVHLRGNDVRIQEVSNCIIQGNLDTVVAWTTDVQAPRPNPMILSVQNVNGNNPLFVKPPTTFGPNANTDSADFRLISRCTDLSPAWNAGSNAAYSGLAGMLDKAGNARIACDTVDIGPYEIIAQFKRAHINRVPADSTYCSNDLQLSASTTCNPKPLYTWQYNDGSNWSNISSGNSPVYKSNSPRSGLYRLVYSEQDCGHADTSRNISISLKPAPQPFLGNDTTIEQKASLTLNPGSYSSYRWQDGSAASTFSVNGIAAGIGKKAYHVTVSSANGCTGSDTIQVTVVWNSALEQLQQAGWKLYPNPALNLVHLESPDGAAFTWTLTDQSGRAIGSGSSTEARADIDISTQPCGLYYLCIRSKNHSQTLTLQKM